MARDTKYGDIDIEKIGKDEPVFILRAQDRKALQAMARYRSICEEGGVEQSHLDAIDRAYDAFTEWQRTHATKLPDTPSGTL